MQFSLSCAHALLINFSLVVCLVRYLMYYYYFALFSLLIYIVNNCAHTVGGSS